MSVHRCMALMQQTKWDFLKLSLFTKLLINMVSELKSDLIGGSEKIQYKASHENVNINKKNEDRKPWTLLAKVFIMK